jgi:hypothetical protein
MKRTFLFTSCILSGVLVLSISTILNSCKSKVGGPYELTGDTLADGKALVQQHCTKCHALVPVDALTKDVWTIHTLPAMAQFFSIKTYGADYYKADNDTSGMSLVNWQAIVSYYKKAAPDTLVAAKAPKALLNDWAGFTLRKAEKSCIGRMDPVDFPNGRVFKVNLGSTLTLNQLETDLPRPVQTLSADFDKDGKQEVVVCAQGFHTGGVYLLKAFADGKGYKRTSITDRPGAVQAITGDFNNDGWADVMVLYGTGDEGLAMYINNKKGGFEATELMKFPPTNSSTSFQLADIDHDGDLDLVYTCGYNFHDSRILKPYHGLYIYENTGKFNFKQKWFYPINGCTKAIAADFDGDGDLDIATIAFFADMKDKPAEEFIYFEQDKAMQFKPHAIPVSKLGRWMGMDVADINHDGKPDILLANYATGFLFQPNFAPNWDEHTPFIVLENHTKK